MSVPALVKKEKKSDRDTPGTGLFGVSPNTFWAFFGVVSVCVDDLVTGGAFGLVVVVVAVVMVTVSSVEAVGSGNVTLQTGLLAACPEFGLGTTGNCRMSW